MIALDANKLNCKIVEKGFTIFDISNLFGVNKVTTHRKLRDANELTISEASRLKLVLGLSDAEAVSIFFGGIEI